MFLFKSDIPRIQNREVIPVFSGRDGCLDSWPDCCFQWYADRAPSQQGRYPKLSQELINRVEADLKTGASSADIAINYGLSPYTIGSIKRGLGLQKKRVREYKPRVKVNPLGYIEE